MVTKKFEQFITELKYQTYAKAAKKLSDMGHVKRADKIKKHNSIHRLKMDMLENYSDLRPFEMWVNDDNKGYQEPDLKQENKVTVYLASWSYIPSEDNECNSVDIAPIFLFNSKEPYMDPSKFDLFKGEKEHKKGLDDILSGEFMFNLSYYNDSVHNLYSFEGDNRYFKFTNRRDAVRFIKIIKSDQFFIENLVNSTNNCENLDPFLIHQEFIDNLKVNDIYLD